jgi:hypothetical protein
VALVGQCIASLEEMQIWFSEQTAKEKRCFFRILAKARAGKTAYTDRTMCNESFENFAKFVGELIHVYRIM